MSTTKGNQILVLGSANTDFVIHTKRMPMLGETITGSHFSINAGGKGLNQAVAVKKLGGDVAFIGAVGNDPNGKILLETLSALKIPFEGFTLPEHATGIAMITVVDGDNFIVLHEGANQGLTPERIREKDQWIQQADYLVLQLEIPTESVICACKIAKECGTKVILNPAPVKELPEQLFPMIDYLIPNEHEVFALTGVLPETPDACKAAIHTLQQMGVKNVVITLGERGCAYTDNGRIYFCDAIPTTAIDTTSAGDSFIGAFVSQLSKGGSVSDSIAFATKAASVTVSRHGAAASIPFAHELQEESI